MDDLVGGCCRGLLRLLRQRECDQHHSNSQGDKKRQHPNFHFSPLRRKWKKSTILHRQKQEGSPPANRWIAVCQDRQKKLDLDMAKVTTAVAGPPAMPMTGIW